MASWNMIAHSFIDHIYCLRYNELIGFLLSILSSYRYIIMKEESKMGLRNASNILNQLRRKYLKPEQEELHPLHHNKTFIEEQSLELYENQITLSNRRPSQYQKASKNDDPVAQISEIKEAEREQASFCDKLIIQQLERTLKVYQQDLVVLTDNRSFLEQQLQFLADKIRKLNELEHNNHVLTAQNQKAKRQLHELIQQYHHSMWELFKSKIAQQESFNALRNKVTKVIKETGEDYHYIGFVAYWNRHTEQCLADRHAIDIKIDRDQTLERQRQKEKEAIPPKVQKVVVAASREKNSKIEEDYLTPDEPKPKKRLSEAEKANLLGDLKSFAKSFKLP